MKKLICTIMLTLLALSLTACAGVGQKEQVSVKCPACGYTGLADIYQP